MFRILQRRFHLEFYEGAFKTYTLDRKLQTLKDMVDFVSKKCTFKILDRAWFGQDSDLERTVRYMQLVLLYNESKGSLELI